MVAQRTFGHTSAKRLSTAVLGPLAAAVLVGQVSQVTCKTGQRSPAEIAVGTWPESKLPARKFADTPTTCFKQLEGRVCRWGCRTFLVM
jgi:hypothetical protein